MRQLSGMEKALRDGGKITATEWAKGPPARQREMPFGPANIQIPFSNRVYRPTIDESLLGSICRRAFSDWAASRLPDSWRAQVIDIITADIDRRFPPEDRAVLRKHGFTRPTDKIHVSVTGGFILYHRPIIFEMAEERDIPQRAAFYAAVLGKENGTGDPEVPADAVPYFRTWDEVHEAQRDQFLHAIQWPSQFKARNRRWPLWSEIEDQWPRIHAWLEGQREAVQ